MMLGDEKVDFIKAEIEKSSISISALKEDLLDHFCCFIEHEMKRGQPFEIAYAKAMEQICPNGFDEIQKETIYLLNSKKIMTMKKVMYSVGLITSISVSIGWLFKILHWPGGNQLFVYGFLGLVLIFLPMLAVDRYKVNLAKVFSEKLKIILGFSSAMVIGLGVLLKIMHLSGGDMLLISGILLFSFGFLPFFFFRMYRKSVE
ncbi:hypothetical protein QQ020_24115 [Fulvivirgaceae bacterium BMA12]|uniref:DUF1129 domain-containing protein n=1 Tax=Agaribacillus aureus TaxID=3051825 RepID=A0ABT8LBN1_9BACT|nr:hypothetical protein [Fulvivirgaceae bacterium BMA12]